MLGVLALVDSTSVGTLFLPAWMLMVPGRVRVGRVLLHLVVVAGCYTVLGAVLLVLGRSVSGLSPGPALRWAQLVAGVALFVLSFVVDDRRKRELAAAQGLPPRMRRWRDRVSDASPRVAVVVAFTAVAVEAASMLPYLGALGLMTRQGFPVPVLALALVGYCVVMVVPALVLLGARVLAGPRVDPVLARLDAWIVRHGDAALGWCLGIAGFLLARDAVSALW